MIKPAIPLTPRALFVLALLIILGFLGNYWSLPLFFGVDFILGSIPVLIVVYFYGVGLGTLAALIASSYTYFLWGHPYAPLTGTQATGYLCVPLMAQGNSLGIFHIRLLSCATQGREAGGLEAKERLAVAIAENLSLALANLKLRETLQNQAIRDPLTGLYNRRYLEETMDRELHRSRRLKVPLGVVMMTWIILKTSTITSATQGEMRCSALWLR